MAEGLKKMLGEGINTWFGTDGKVFLQATASDWKSAQKLIDQYLDGKAKVGDQQAYQDSRKALPADTTVVALIDLPMYGKVIYEFVQTLFQGGGLPFNLPPLKAGKTKPTYTSVAVTLKEQRVSFDLWVPTTTATEIYNLVEPIIKMFMNPGGIP
jgi:hypothetical protein